MPDLAHLTVLVADDEDAVRRILLKALTGLGIERVELATDVQSAARLARTGAAPVDIVLCDLQMPGGGSRALLRELAALPAAPDVVLMSGAGTGALDDAEAVARELKLPVIGRLDKPFTPRDVAAVLGASGRISPPSPPDLPRAPGPRPRSGPPTHLPVVDLSPAVPLERVRDFAHEASAPLMAINMLSDLLLEDESLPDAQRDDVRQIQQAAADLARMLARLRDEASARPKKSEEDR